MAENSWHIYDMKKLRHCHPMYNICPSLIEIGSKTAEKNSAQTNRETDRHYENNGHLAVNQLQLQNKVTLQLHCLQNYNVSQRHQGEPQTSPLRNQDRSLNIWNQNISHQIYFRRTTMFHKKLLRIHNISLQNHNIS